VRLKPFDRKKKQKKLLSAEIAKNGAKVAEKINATTLLESVLIFSAFSRFSLRSLRSKAFDLRSRGQKSGLLLCRPLRLMKVITDSDCRYSVPR
jgi:hypothetical protein